MARPGVAVPAGTADGKVAGRSDIPEENMLFCGIPPAPVDIPLTPAAPGAPRDPNDWDPGIVDGKPRSPPTTGQAAHGTRHTGEQSQQCCTGAEAVITFTDIFSVAEYFNSNLDLPTVILPSTWDTP